MPGKGLVKSGSLVGLGQQQVDQSHQGALKLRPVLGLDGDRAEGPPDDVLGYVDGDEEGDS